MQTKSFCNFLDIVMVKICKISSSFVYDNLVLVTVAWLYWDVQKIYIFFWVMPSPYFSLDYYSYTGCKPQELASSYCKGIEKKFQITL